ncbi:3-isopropylmalate dehydrogenase [candidate division KSB1 bacterium]|nr:MAG: 3-isopropylmalate dehydrogenase [candidate division KSB1 bacterium]
MFTEKQKTITVLPGDGIGPEVTAAAVKVLETVAAEFNMELKLTEKPFGGNSIDRFGEPLTDDTLQTCLNSDAVLLGAVGGPKWENLAHHKKPEAGLLAIRKELGLFANIRPAKVYPAFENNSTLKPEVLRGTNFVVLRELTGGIYFGQPRGYNADKGWNTMVYEKFEVERIARKAFEIAKIRNKRVTSVDKANVLDVSQFWREVVAEVHRDYPKIELNNLYVDNAAMQIVRDPGQFDVILTSNLFGDILSDIAGMITGSLGMLPSASLGEEHALYEPVHGSAPDIAGQGKANPIAAIASVAMMFNYSFQMTKAAELIEKAIEKALADGYRTQDIFQKGTKLVNTEEMTHQIVQNFEEIFHEEGLGVFTL